MAISLIIALAGTRHFHAGCFAASLRSGTPVRLVREPDNGYDKNAIAVWVSKDGLVGQAGADLRHGSAALIAPLIDRGEEFTAKIQQHRKTSVVIEIAASDPVIVDLMTAAAR